MKPLPPYAVVADTNALWGGKHLSALQHSSFTKLLTECREFAPVRLIVPEIVRSERIFQAVSAALTAVENARSNFETINLIAPFQQDLPNADALKAQAEVRFDAWLEENDGTVGPIPYDKIDWPQLVSDCVWRKPPFSTAALEKPTEKGFRDSLILLSLGAAADNRGERNIVFISDDRLLREAAIERFKSDAFNAYPRMGEFLDFLKLRLDQHAAEFINGMLEKAPKVFNDSVFTGFNVATRIREGFALRLAPPQLAKPNFGLGAKLPASHYKLVSERFTVRDTRYAAISKERRYFWKTIIALKQYAQSLVRLVSDHRPYSRVWRHFRAADFFDWAG